MVYEHLDLVSLLQQRIDESVTSAGLNPTVLTLSPRAYSWLLSVFSEDERLFGISPLDTETCRFNTDRLSLKIEIDELADDYEVLVS